MYQSKPDFLWWITIHCVVSHSHCFASVALVYRSICLKGNTLYGEVPTQLRLTYLEVFKIYIQFNNYHKIGMVLKYLYCLIARLV